MTQKIAVLYGGWSSEREVSLSSGAACAKALEGLGYHVDLIDVDRQISNILSEKEPDIALNALHGAFGEDGGMQAILEALQIPYTHSGVLASALAMDKHRAKIIMKDAGVATARHVIASAGEIAQAHLLEPPYVVKPVDEGSSFGVLIVKESDAPLGSKIESITQNSNVNLMVENYCAGMELTCAIMGGRALDVMQIKPNKEGFYDYAAKYEESGSTHKIPAPLSPNIYQKIQKMSEQAYTALGCRGVARADFRLDPEKLSEDDMLKNEALICLEVNTQPGMTKTSLVPEIAAHAGLSFEELISWMVKDASCQR